MISYQLKLENFESLIKQYLKFAIKFDFDWQIKSINKKWQCKSINEVFQNLKHPRTK